MTYTRSELKVESVERYILGGKATITLFSEQTEKHYTYKISKCKTSNTLFFVSLLIAPNEYQYIGILTTGNSGLTFKSTRATSIPVTSKPFQAFRFFTVRLVKNDIPSKLRIFHEGRCGKCGRKLTTPESIERGFGAVCYERG